MNSHQRLSLAYLLALYQLAIKGCDCFAPTRLPQRHQPSKSTNGHAFDLRTASSLFAQKDDDDDDNDNDNKPINDLDIFGQPKEKQKKKPSNNFFFGGDDDSEAEIQGPDRIKSCIPYALVLIDGDSFGKYIYERIPALGTMDYIFLRPIVDAVQAVPFLSIILFVIFALGPQFTNQSRSVRFNAQQAILIDVALIFPVLIGDAIEGESISRALVEPCTNFVWYAYMSGVIYCVVSCLRGRKPDGIPFISSTAEYAIGPF